MEFQVSRTKVEVDALSPFSSSFEFSRALRVGTRVIVSGVSAVGEDGICSTDIGVQARRCFDRVGSFLEQLDSSLEKVVQMNIYLPDRADCAAIAQVQGEVFKGIKPALSVFVGSLLDPAWKIQVDAEAVD